MDKLSEILNKYLVYLLYVFFIVTMFNTCNGCSSNKNDEKLKKRMDSLTVEVNAFRGKIYSKEQMDIRLKILALEEEKSTLFNVNYIVLTKTRPDIRMNELDQKIKELQEKIK